MGFEPTAFSLATRRSTPELHPQTDQPDKIIAEYLLDVKGSEKNIAALLV